MGAIKHIPLDALTANDEDLSKHECLIGSHNLVRKRRAFNTHKGQAGRVAIWAGSEGMLGAAVLAASAALRAGAGLVTAFVTPDLYSILAPMMPIEVMLKISTDPQELIHGQFDSFVIGPGIGEPQSVLANSLLDAVGQSTKPMVLDADMLNLIAKYQAFDQLHPNCILTPHPGEMQRLFPAAAVRSREETVRSFLEQHPVTLLYKGARTIIAQTNGPLYINSSGTPAMATAGQGDVLAGLIAGFCAQGYSNLEATQLAAWAAGEAAQLALADQSATEETLTASTTLAKLPQALQQLTRTCH